MSNKRSIKKNIHRICGEAAIDVLMNLPSDKAREIVIKIAELQTTSLANMSFDFDRSRRDFPNGRMYNQARRHYNRQAIKKLNTEFNNALKRIVEQLNGHA